MADSTIWWMLAGGAVALELATGTFYLLMLALGLAAAAIATHLGLGLAMQVVVAALVGGLATALWYAQRARAPAPAPASANPDVIMDVGAQIHVTGWLPDGTARVTYRGSQWHARPEPGVPTLPGAHTVSAVEGHVLVLKPLPSAPAGSPLA